MKKLFMMIGIPGSGKTTVAKKLNQEFESIIVSSDLIRKANPTWPEERIFPEAYRIIQENIKNVNVIFDATNIDPKTRKMHLDEIRKKVNDFQAIAYLVECDAKVCKDRIKLRNQNEEELYLPPEVVDIYKEKLIVPLEEELFSEIIVFNNSKDIN